MADKTKTIVIGGGCFWCTEAVFKMFDGILKVDSGYAGGNTVAPTYEDVCSGTTGHAEVIELTYDPAKISLEKILEIFFKAHDPTTLNQQGADVGSQYRSIILYNTPEEKKVIDGYIKGIASDYKKPITTEVKKLDKFYPSEDYHKDYYKNNPFQPYCMLVIRPKVDKVKKEFQIK